MTAPRVLDPEPATHLDAHIERGGGRALELAAAVDPDDLITLVTASGLRGRGGAGFPTGIKWRTVADNGAASAARPAVLVNAAEGEPGTFKDRAILRANPYRVIEGALIAARAVHADEVIVATKASFTTEVASLRRAIDEFTDRGLHDVTVRVVEGPDSYLYGEESAMLEVVEGRHPFPRVTPPYRRGLDQRPVLVDNVETLANVPNIVEHGPDWFRAVGTEESPGTIVCTVVGATVRHGVAEVPMGTPLWDVIDVIGGGPEPGRTLIAAMSGTANAALAADRFDTPLTYEHMAAAGAGLGTGGFIVFDDRTDLIAAAHGIARFLAVESCGQCTPCKYDGLAIAGHLDAIRRSSASPRDLAVVDHRFGTVADGARCALAAQQQHAVASLVQLGRETARAHVDRRIDPAPQFLIAPIVDLADGVATVDEGALAKQPDWSTDGVDSGATPVELLGGAPLDVPDAADTSVAADTEQATAGADPFEIVRDHHRRLRTDLFDAADAAESADEEGIRAVFERLDRDVGQYLDLAGRVLYPTLSRATFSTGDDVAWAASFDAARATELSARLARQADARGGVDADAFDRLIEELADLVACDEEAVIPVLAERLDDVRLRDLHDALAEVDQPARVEGEGA